jgi:RES domain-containing protein
LQKTGSRWYTQAKHPALKVPSVVIPQEHNYLLNVNHPEFAGNVRIKSLEDYFWDERLVF